MESKQQLIDHLQSQSHSPTTKLNSQNACSQTSKILIDNFTQTSDPMFVETSIQTETNDLSFNIDALNLKLQ